VEEHFVPARVRIKDDGRTFADYFVSWTPNVVIADERGEVHYRIEGFHQPQNFIAKLSLGAATYHLHRMEYNQAAERYEEVARRHPETNMAAEALYWLGVTNYKQSQDANQLRANWQRLARDYPNSGWTKRTEIPAFPGSA
jgi:tetratricopeptide (TPR) repeat protein